MHYALLRVKKLVLYLIYLQKWDYFYAKLAVLFNPNLRFYLIQTCGLTLRIVYY